MGNFAKKEIMALVNTWKEQWEKGGRIGKGGQGLTFFVTHKESGEQFAIKFLKEQGILERRERMYVEVSSLKILNHPNIPKLIDSNESTFKDITHKLYMVSEYIPGITLQDHIDANGIMNLEDAISFTIKLSEIIKYCHSKGFIHRDIKPDNIILKNNEIINPFLIDFGLSFNENISLEKADTPSWQHIGNRFLSLPELRVSEGNKRDFRSDATMICGILFFCLTGIHPTDLVDENMAKPHRREKGRNIIDTLPEYKIASVNNFFDIAFNQAINNRWQTAEIIITTLKEILNMKPADETNKDINQKLEEFKAKLEKRLDFKHLDEIGLVFKNCDDIVNRAAKEVINRLKPVKFGTSQTGYSLNVSKQVYTNQLGLTAPYSNDIIFYPRFSCYSNGSEFIFDAIESGQRTELSRFQLNEDINWEKLFDAVTEYYINGVASK
jgi:serine/threonine-protein kinase